MRDDKKQKQINSLQEKKKEARYLACGYLKSAPGGLYLPWGGGVTSLLLFGQLIS